jgi:hypothetical protein
VAQVQNAFDSACYTSGVLDDASLLGEDFEREPRFSSPDRLAASGLDWTCGSDRRIQFTFSSSAFRGSVPRRADWLEPPLPNFPVAALDLATIER